eukprot:1250266-Amphidinium_carterae.1
MQGFAWKIALLNPVECHPPSCSAHLGQFHQRRKDRAPLGCHDAASPTTRSAGAVRGQPVCPPWSATLRSATSSPMPSLRVLLAVLKVDVKKAFDSVWHSSILDMLAHQHAPCWLQRAILQSLTVKCAMMRAPVGYVEFAMQTGVQQGRLDSPELFNRTVGYALRHVVQKWREQPGPAALCT